MENPSLLCDKCRGMADNGPGWVTVPIVWGSKKEARLTDDRTRAIYVHHPTLSVLKRKAAEGCPVCQVFLGALFKGEEPPPDPPTDSASDSHSRDGDVEETTAQLERIVDQFVSSGILESLVLDLARRHQGSQLAYLDEKLQDYLGPGRIMIGTDTQIPWDFVNDRVPSKLHVHCLGQKGPEKRERLGGDSCRVRVWIEHDDPLRKFAGLNCITPAPSIFSDLYLKRVRGWLDTCAAEHPECQGVEEPKELPTRLVEVGPLGADSVRVVTHPPGTKGIYACLSYSWGQGLQKCTTVGNLAEHLSGIPLSEVPATIADAIKLCRGLDIPYIWVDALCIIQDDRDDWSKEAALMASVYGKAVLTISSSQTGSSDRSFERHIEPTRSFFPQYKREVLYSAPPMSWTHPSGLQGTVTLKNNWYPWHGIFDGHWATRGWTVQEWLLSPRVLHCSVRYSMFDCFHGNQSELNPDAVPEQHSGKPSNPPAERDPLSSLTDVVRRIARTERRKVQGRSAASLWRWVVDEFSGRDLTNEGDKLPALAGIAAQFRNVRLATSPQHDHVYLAGLWWSPQATWPSGYSGPDLPTGLLWNKTERQFLKTPSAKVFRAPSWSWAALDGSVTFPWLWDGNVTSRVRICDASCVYERPDSLSSVTSGYIDVEGFLKRGRGRETNLMHARQGGFDAYLSTYPEGARTTDCSWGLRWDLEMPREPSDAWDELVQAGVYFLPVATAIYVFTTTDTQRVSHEFRRVTHHALVLKRVETEDDGQIECFSRLGTANMDNVPGLGSAYYANVENHLDDWDHKKIRLL